MSTLANPLPPDIVEGDSGDTDVRDDNDTPPGFDRDFVRVLEPETSDDGD